MTRERNQSYRAALRLACVLYLAACALPATKVWGSPNYFQGGREQYLTRYGFVCLALGWIAVPEAFDQDSSGMALGWAWLANPLAFVGAVLLLHQRPAGAAAFGAVSVVLGAQYVIFPPGRPYPDLPQIGAWLWLCSLLALTVAALIRRASSQAQKHTEPPNDL